ncbi:MAG: hypothetical protein ACYS1A_20025, partial [Planctomycetota bacterium]
SKNGYQVGAALTVEVTQKEGQKGPWNQFKRIDPQNNQQGHHNAPQGNKPDWDAIAEGKVRHGLVCAGIQSGQLKIGGIPDILYWAEFIVNGKAPLPPAQHNEEDVSSTAYDNAERF